MTEYKTKVKMQFILDDENYIDQYESLFDKAKAYCINRDDGSIFSCETESRKDGTKIAVLKLNITTSSMSAAGSIWSSIKSAIPTLPKIQDGKPGFQFRIFAEGNPVPQEE